MKKLVLLTTLIFGFMGPAIAQDAEKTKVDLLAEMFYNQGSLAMDYYLENAMDNNDDIDQSRLQALKASFKDDLKDQTRCISETILENEDIERAKLETAHNMLFVEKVDPVILDQYFLEELKITQELYKMANKECPFKGM